MPESLQILARKIMLVRDLWPTHSQPLVGEARTPSPRRMEPTQVGVLRGEEEEELHLGAFMCLFIYLSKN